MRTIAVIVLLLPLVLGQILPEEEEQKEDTESTSEGSDVVDSRMLIVLQSISERLRALEDFDKQRLSKLQSLDYRFEKLESSNEERIIGLRTEVETVSRNLQGVQWDVNKVTTLLEVLRQDVARIMQAVTEMKVLTSRQASREISDDIGSGKNERVGSRLRVISTLHNIKTNVAHLLDSVQHVAEDSKQMLNLSTSTFEQTSALATKTDLHENLLDVRQQCSTREASPPPPTLTTTEPMPESCADLQGVVNSGVHLIRPKGSQPFFAFCELKCCGGGWTVFQNRIDGATDFYRKWLDYKYGFGNIGGEFWLGLEKLRTMTTRKIQTLRIELVDFELAQVEAEYKSFAIGSEMESYSLKVLSDYNGTAGDSLSYQSGMKFSTWDNDNDVWEEGNCAKDHTGAWWYKGCETSNLNGKYLTGRLPEDLKSQGIYWYDFHGNLYSLMKVRMMIRPRDWREEKVSEVTQPMPTQQPEPENTSKLFILGIDVEKALKQRNKNK